MNNYKTICSDCGKEINSGVQDFGHTCHHAKEGEKFKGTSWRKGYMQGIKEKEQEIIVLRSDIQRAIGRMQGLGHHDKYLEEKYKSE